MIKRLLLGVAILLMTNIGAIAQSVALEPAQKSTLEAYQDTLLELGIDMLHNRDANTREAALEKFLPTLEKALAVQNSFQFKFDSLTMISIQYPADSSFRIFTWQIFVDNENYKYYGGIQKNKTALEYYPLEDKSSAVFFINKDILSPDKWYGALYYNIKEYKTKKGKRYMLFGYDAFTFYNKRKLLEILYFDEETGKPIFGEAAFNLTLKKYGVPPRDVTYTRFYLEYSSDSKVTLNYKEDEERIVFDHLIPMGSPYGDNRMMNLPDGSYDGFELKKDVWVMKEKLYNEVLDEAPRPAPVLDNKKDRGLFGGDE